MRDDPAAISGNVYLVGAGLGNRETLTVRALQLLHRADVVVSDDLVPPSLLAELPAHCVVLNVGKRGGQPSTPQADIHRHLVEQCRLGKQVVRLQSGDPGVFGRLTEEVAALRDAGCLFEIVPGLSAATAGPLVAGIPLTEKRESRCFAVLTAHDIELLPWPALAELDTLAILMGTRTLPDICDRLLNSGKPADTPVALVRDAGRPSQQVCTGKLGTFASQMAAASQSLSPAVIVVGQVVRWRSLLWQPDKRPLSRKTVLVTRANPQSGSLTQLLEAQGAAVVEMPTLEILPPSDYNPLDTAIAQLDSFDWLILTSGNGVEGFFQRLSGQGKDSRALHGVRIAVVGQKTAEVLQGYGIRPDFVPDEFVADALAASLPLAREQPRILFPRVQSGGRPTLVVELAARGATVVEVPAYQSDCPRQIDPVALKLLQAQQIDILTFASSKTVRYFHRLLQQAEFDFAALESAQIAAIGPKTAETCSELLGRTDICARDYTMAGLVEAIVEANRSSTSGTIG